MQPIRIELIIDDPELLKRPLVIHVGKDTREIVAREVPEAEEDFFDFMQATIRKLQQQGSRRTAENYTSALRSLQRFWKEGCLPFSRIDGDMALAYERHLKSRGNTPNTTSFYMRILRAVYNRGVQSGLVSDKKPFAHVYTSIAKTEKRAVSLDVIRRLQELPLKRKTQQLARDLFLFSFYTRGMSFVDMAFLKKENLRNGMLTYTRSKTGQPLAIRWERAMQDIVERHPEAEKSPYLLPIIGTGGRDDLKQYRLRLWSVNQELKTIGTMLGLDSPLTMYVARHSWASIAKAMSVPTEIISQAMGHTSEKTTRIYLKQIGNEPIDHANRRIMDQLFAKKSNTPQPDGRLMSCPG